MGKVKQRAPSAQELILFKRTISRPVPGGRYSGWIVELEQATEWGRGEYLLVTLYLNRRLDGGGVDVFGIRCQFPVWLDQGKDGLRAVLRALGRSSALGPDGVVAREKLMGAHVAADIELALSSPMGHRLLIVEKIGPMVG